MDEIDVWSAVESGIVDPRPTVGWTLYFDETNNYRKFTIDPNKEWFVNEKKAIYNDFILGGIAVPPGVKLNLQNLKEQLGLPTEAEMKSKSFFKTGDLIYDMGSDRVRSFLKWMVRNPILIHFFCSDNIYDAVIEVVDKSMQNEGGRITMFFHIEMKDSLYDCVMSDPIEFLKILNEFGYPAVKIEDESSFCETMARFIHCRNDDSTTKGFHLEMLRQNLMAASREDGDGSLCIGNEGEMVSDYSSGYWGTILNTPCAMHIFDHETQIERKLRDIKILDHGRDYLLIDFQDSKDCPQIQISDVVVGILGRVFSWIDLASSDDVAGIIDEMTTKQMESFSLLNSLIDRTDEYCRFMIQNMVSTGKTSRRFEVIQQIADRFRTL